MRLVSRGAYNLAKKSGNFGLNSHGKVIFRNSLPKLWSTFRDTPVFPFGTKRRKIPCHLLKFPVSSLSSVENNYGKKIANGMRHFVRLVC